MPKKSPPRSPGLWFTPTKPVSDVQTYIAGHPWTIRFIDRTFPRNLSKDRRYEGLCDYDARTITIYLRGVEDVRLTLIHELLHASMPYLDELEVDRVSRDLHRAMNDAG